MAMGHLLWLVALCAMMGAAVGQDLPPACLSTDKIPIPAICEALKLTSSQAEGCPAIPFVENVALNFLPPACNALPAQAAGLLPPPTTDPHGTVLPQDLPDIRTYRGGLPQNLNYQSFMEAEGSTYYWYWRNLLTLANWAPCTLGSNLPLPLPQGWTTVGTFSQPPKEIPDGNVTIPLAALIKPEASTSHERYDSCKRWYARTTANMRVARATSKRGPSTEYGHSEYGQDQEHTDYDGGRDSYSHRGHDHDDDQMYGYDDERYGDNYNCGNKEEGASHHLVLLIRGSLLPSEWAADLAYNQVVQPELGPGSISTGFALVAQTLWASGLGEAIRTEISNGCRSITIAGHSLGGAVAQLLAVRIEALLTASDSYPDSPKVSPVTVVTFGSPNVGDSMWAANFNRKINARQIAFEGDVVTKIPCEPQIVGCPNPPVQIPTLPGPWSYKRAGANIVYPALAMPFNSVNNVKQSWAQLLSTTPQQLCTGAFAEATKAAHVCSYLCMTAQYIGMANNMCWLDATVNAPAGTSQCNFPRGTPGKLDRLA